MDSNSHTEIALRLREDIRSGRLAAGAALQQEALAERFGVSRQPVRLAIENLRAAGWIEPGRGRSMKVSEMTASALRDLVDVRRLIEGEALARAIPRREDRDILAATHLQERIEIESDPAILESLDVEFHAALYRPAGNPRLLALIDDLRGEDRRPYHEQQPRTPIRDTWNRQHRDLLDAYRAGDAARAAACLERHLSQLLER